MNIIENSFKLPHKTLDELIIYGLNSNNITKLSVNGEEMVGYESKPAESSYNVSSKLF